MNAIPADFDGLIAVVKQDCPTCRLIEPVLSFLAQAQPLQVYTQDDTHFPAGVSNVIDDRELEFSYHLEIEIVPTLIQVQQGKEVARVIGWNKSEWQAFTAMPHLGQDLPDFSPGCGSRSVEPGIAEKLAIRFDALPLQARRIELADLEDEVEACFERGWTDGLPVVPPTPERVLRMLSGTNRPPDEIVGVIPPDNVPCAVEKVAINAVMAGCKPEYMPVVLAAVEAACDDEFCMHGLLATTYFSGPVVVVNGPITKKIGMNSGINALGQGNRANATIGRALQLVVRNVGGGRPGEVDRAALGNPGKYTFCFAEREDDAHWESLAVERGFSPEDSTVTLFAGDGVQAVMDQLSRTPESLTKSIAMSLRAVCHTKIAMAADAMLVITPEHMRVFSEAAWSKARFREELAKHLTFEGNDLVRGANGIAEGIPVQFEEATLPKFRPGGLLITHAGGGAGLWTAIIGGWPASGTVGSNPVTKLIK